MTPRQVLRLQAAARRRDLRVTLRLPDPCLVVLVGATGAGKSAWAGAWFHADQIVSSDRLRAVVGAGERDQRASRDAFEVLDLIVAKRLRRGLTTVVDTTGLEPKRRAAWRALAEREGVPAYAVVVDTPEKVVRERNRARGAPVPAKVVAAQLREAAGAREALAGEGFAGVFDAGPVELVPPAFLAAPGGGGAPGRGAAAARVRPPALALRLGGRHRGRARRGRARGRGGGLHEPVGDGPLPPDPAGGARVGGHARELHDARLPRGRDRADPARHARHRRHLPQPRPPRQARRDARRALRRPRAVRARDRVVRARAQALRLGLPAARPSATRCSRTRSSCCR